VATGPFGVQYANLPVSIDDELLTEIADATGGRYFRATNPAALDSVYEQIDQLEKTSVDVSRYVSYTPRYLPFLLFAALLLASEWLLRASRFGRVP
jgi:Ca-activated chloride channel family protein